MVEEARINISPWRTRGGVLLKGEKEIEDGIFSFFFDLHAP